MGDEDGGGEKKEFEEVYDDRFDPTDDDNGRGDAKVRQSTPSLLLAELAPCQSFVVLPSRLRVAAIGDELLHVPLALPVLLLFADP